MRLSSLLSALREPNTALEWVRERASDDPTIRGIRYDSRQVSPGDLFVALRGATADGHDYVERAVALGAAALLVEEIPAASKRRDVPAVRVRDTRRALAPLAAHFFGNPASELALIGVTGTNGKTSTTYLVESILKQAGLRTGLVGTVEIRYAGEREPAVNTTPESLDLQRMLRAMCNAQVDATVMEVSSHGLELGRVDGCAFRIAAFTNLSQDHLDFHGSMDAYLASKARLFRDHLAPGATAVLNVDDPAAEKLAGVAREAGANVLRVGRGAAAAADLRLVSSEITIEGTRAVLEDGSTRFPLALPLLGDFNLENLLVAVGIARAYGLETDVIERGVAACPQVPGRMERVQGEGDAGPTVLVDYAHTPDAVEKLLRATRPLSRGRLIAVFGCGGDRDRAKRPLMAEAVARHADLAIATSDNPRTEDPLAILADVERGLAGLEKVALDRLFEGSRGHAVVVDRREAIARAIAGARPEDTVVLAGKGHEDYQIVGREKLPFDDRIEARRALAARESG
ncbi:MAG: UDP-N-acetylmuramoyl-L-alanyl-D-glutamate--2,6-diaminopimelate ligase [Spirochaetaceae bacterium]|nr:UDP-N-acetylmuramoyl-L-alanyl-D-glutamate--2,6-diaminopimelate ligase [Myxococcales bacterium]MCB9724557.1 UDP-N-acetylmuramoyl-L-alanyl-D-glutamate--2,6-diaminopimelate ligase [Spirochaetaceae bacterium]